MDRNSRAEIGCIKQRGSWVKKAALVAAAVLTMVVPATASAQCPVMLSSEQTSAAGSILGVLNETRERIGLRLDNPSPLNQGLFLDGLRVAHAVEKGVLLPGTGCGTLKGFEGEIKVIANSRIPFNATGAALPDLGIGPITGTFKISTAAGHIHGTLSGVLDFVPTNAAVTLCGGPCPFVYTSGKWSTTGSRRRDLNKSGSFSGVALVPFEHPASPSGWMYLDPTGILLGTPGTAGYLPADVVKDFNRDGQAEAKFIINLFD
jgi:hypothetical protein